MLLPVSGSLLLIELLTLCRCPLWQSLSYCIPDFVLYSNISVSIWHLHCAFISCTPSLLTTCFLALVYHMLQLPWLMDFSLGWRPWAVLQLLVAINGTSLIHILSLQIC